jgi:hypothetical protein
MLIKLVRCSRTFEQIASTMRRVGRRKWWETLANAGKDSSAVQACHHLISDLIILFDVCACVSVSAFEPAPLTSRIIALSFTSQSTSDAGIENNCKNTRLRMEIYCGQRSPSDVTKKSCRVKRFGRILPWLVQSGGLM